MTVLFDGIASGMLLFLISVGLSVTLGLMNFVNLAHGAFAMVGGYVCVTLLNRLGVPFLLSLPLAALASAAVGVLLERVLFFLPGYHPSSSIPSVHRLHSPAHRGISPPSFIT